MYNEIKILDAHEARCATSKILEKIYSTAIMDIFNKIQEEISKGSYMAFVECDADIIFKMSDYFELYGYDCEVIELTKIRITWS